MTDEEIGVVRKKAKRYCGTWGVKTINALAAEALARGQEIEKLKEDIEYERNYDRTQEIEYAR